MKDHSGRNRLAELWWLGSPYARCMLWPWVFLAYSWGWLVMFGLASEYLTVREEP